MGEASFARSSFLGGEWSQSMQGRIDRPDYVTALNSCLNAFPLDTGAWTRRPGTRHGGTMKGGKAGRLIPFNFVQNQPYGVEFTDGIIRMWSGPALAMTNDAVTVAAISTANPAVVQTSTAVTWVTGDEARITGLSTLCPLLQNRTVTLTKIDTTHFSIADGVTGAAIDGATLGWVTPATLPTISRVLNIVSPYTTDLWTPVRLVQANTRAILLHGTVAPRILTATALPTLTTYAEFTLAAANFKDGPYLDPVTGGALLTPSGTTGNVTMTISFNAYDATKSYAIGDFVTSSNVNYQSRTDANLNHTPASNPTDWLAVSAGVAVGPNGFVATDVGRLIRVFSEPPLWATATDYVAGNVVAYGDTYWTALISMTGAVLSTGQTNPNQPGLKTTTWALNPTAAKWSWGKITGLGNTISGTLAGSANIGDLTGGGGLTALFDGTLSKASSLCATFAQNLGPAGSFTKYAGKNYSGATDQAIGAVAIYPSTDKLFGGLGNDPTQRYEFTLYGKASLPSSATDGTSLGTASFVGDTASAILITSSNTTTAWKYVWVAIKVTNLAGTNIRSLWASQIQFYSPVGSGTSSGGITVQILGGSLLYTTAIRVWRLGAYSDTTGYPTCGTYHEGRIWFSGAIANRIDSSVSNGVLTNGTIDMTPTNETGVVADSNAISYTFNADEVNAIFWMLSDQQGIICGTQAGEWLVQASANNNKLTPTSMQAHRVTKNGCANIEPKRTGLTIAFVQRFKHKVMEYFADVMSGKFSSPNLSLTAKHLATRGIEEIAYQSELSPIVWSRCTDNSLIGVTYKRESLQTSQGPAFAGWHQHTLGSAREVESLCVGPSTDGLLDTLSLVTNDTASDVRHVEFLTNIWEEGSGLTDAWFADNAVAPSSWEIVTTAGTDYLKLYGLWHLNGKTVAAWVNGLDCGDFAVASGTINIPLPAAGGALTTAIINGLASLSAVVGFSYSSRGQIVRPASREESGARNGPAFAKLRRSEKFGALLIDTQGIKFGTSFTAAKMHTANFKTPGGTPYPVSTLFSGTYKDDLTDSDDFDSMICWEVTRPYPATVAMVGGFLNTKDT